jgi:hypothetical protein
MGVFSTQRLVGVCVVVIAEAWRVLVSPNSRSVASVVLKPADQLTPQHTCPLLTTPHIYFSVQNPLGEAGALWRGCGGRAMCPWQDAQGTDRNQALLRRKQTEQPKIEPLSAFTRSGSPDSAF